MQELQEIIKGRTGSTSLLDNFKPDKVQQAVQKKVIAPVKQAAKQALPAPAKKQPASGERPWACTSAARQLSAGRTCAKPTQHARPCMRRGAQPGGGGRPGCGWAHRRGHSGEQQELEPQQGTIGCTQSACKLLYAAAGPWPETLCTCCGCRRPQSRQWGRSASRLLRRRL